MDYEKKYKKALSRAEELMSRCVNNGDYKTIIYRAEDIESIFPELQEPDDDTIRRALLRGFKNYSIYYDTFGKADVNSIIAWLEKQGEKSQGNTALETIKKEGVDNGKFE